MSSLPASKSEASLITPTDRKRSINEMDQSIPDFSIGSYRFLFPNNATLTKVSNASKRSAINSSSSSTGNYANKEPRRSSSTTSCVYGRYVSQCEEYGRGSITSIIPTEKFDGPQDSSTSLSSSSSSSSSASLPNSFSSSSPLPFYSTIESLSQQQYRSTRLEFFG